MKKIIFIILIIIALSLLVKAFDKKGVTTDGNPPNSAENAPPGSIHNLPVPEAVRFAKGELAAHLKIEPSQILILEAVETQWPDACLGIQEKDKVCAQVITPGYNILMQANGKKYQYRTNRDGSVIKAETE